MNGLKIKCMLTVLHAVYSEGGVPAALAKINAWTENGWLYPHERRLLFESVALNIEPYPQRMPSCDNSGFDYYSECIPLSEFYEGE